MGTVRAWLRDDVETPDWAGRSTSFDPVPVQVSDDAAGTVVSNVNPSLTVQARTRIGYDDDGVPEFTWVPVVTGETILWEDRTEFDAESGMTRVVGKATLRYEGTKQVTETCMVTDAAGGRWRVTGVAQTPGSLILALARLVQT